MRGAPYAGALGFGAGAVHAGISGTSSGVTDHSGSIGLPGALTFRFATPRPRVIQIRPYHCRIRIQGR